MPATVLVVEDDEHLRFMVVEAISLLGLYVIDCACADDALLILVGSHSIALVVIDVTMPGSIDGLELAQQIWTRWPHLPVIITSGDRSIPDGLMPSHAMFLRKPWSLDVLHAAVRKYLPA